MPIGRIWREHSETLEAALPRVANLAKHFLSWQESHQVRIAAGKIGHRREGNDVYVRLLGDRFYRLDLRGEQRPEDQPGSPTDHRARGARGTGGISAGVVRHQNHAVTAALEQCQLRSVEDRLTECGI